MSALYNVRADILQYGFRILLSGELMVAAAAREIHQRVLAQVVDFAESDSAAAPRLTSPCTIQPILCNSGLISSEQAIIGKIMT